MPADAYLKMTDLEGESTAANHEGEIELLAFSLGVSMPVGPRSTAGSAATEKAFAQDVNVTKNVDKASPQLVLSTAQGAQFKEAVISVNRTDGAGGQVEYVQYKMTDVIISNISQSGGGGGGLPLESLSLNYASILVTYTQTDPSSAGAQGSLTGGWDFGTNQPV